MNKNKIINIEANYTTTLHWDMEEIAKSKGFKLEDVEKIEVGKWAYLWIDLKNGESFKVEPDFLDNSTDYKWADNQIFYDKDCNYLEEKA